MVAQINNSYCISYSGSEILHYSILLTTFNFFRFICQAIWCVLKDYLIILICIYLIVNKVKGISIYLLAKWISLFCKVFVICTYLLSCLTFSYGFKIILCSEKRSLCWLYIFFNYILSLCAFSFQTLNEYNILILEVKFIHLSSMVSAFYLLRYIFLEVQISS